jgi:hypothetical protein
MIWYVTADPLIILYIVALIISIAFLIWFFRWSKSYVSAWDQAYRDSSAKYSFFSPGGGEKFSFIIREIFSVPPGWLIKKRKTIQIILLMTVALFLEGLAFSYILQQSQNLNLAARVDLPELTNQTIDSRLDIIFSSITTVIFPMLAFPILVLSSRVRRAARRTAVHSMEEVRTKDTRAPLLFLRSFHDDQVSFTQNDFGNIFQRALVRGSLFSNLDELLTERYWHIGPVIAIGKPGETLPPLGAARAYLVGESWHTIMANLMREARVIIISLDHTEGVMWELRHAYETGCLNKVLIFIPPRHHGDTRLIMNTLAVLGIEAGTLETVAGSAIAIIPISDGYMVGCCSNRTDSYAYDFVMRVGLHAILENRQRLLELH